ncbi:uncharacterized protein At5g39570-like [Pistacia vera]|uniref:uncharacterized protein At5g39570-like n=1 Tax=Pistacia vera TaxID=55513 RepID=UPI001263B579|nr:uncharacterized protein At5g39570-like [Pistacia vera]XP_031287871.1 uncharacterized protein At5g39570-like [Pistacia vera]XP_031287872.1 uncharacterized protein At5g39570-like [Pistacia vera]
MAYSSADYHHSYLGESYQIPYSRNYDNVPSQVLMADSSQEFSNQNFFEYNPTSYYDAYYLSMNHSVIADSSHEFSNQNFFQYNPTPYYDASYPSVNHSAIAYSVSTFCEPKSIVYDLYHGDYNPSVTHSRVSYSISNSEFDDTEFEEYDPTPYCGGYDITQTYGKPLPPSDNLCYPRSMSDSSVLPSNGVNLGSIESPYGKKDVDESAAKPHIESKQAPTNEDTLQASKGDGQNKEYDNTHGSSTGEDGHENNCEDNPARPNNGNRSNEGNSYEYDTRVTQTPSGYGLEAMDLCESIFGYWPCLARNNKRGHDCQQVFNEESSSNLWKETADYLFGSSNPYGENRDEGGSY